MVDFDRFERNLPDSLLPLLGRINALGFKAYLIGGIPRDYLMKGEIGNDFDFELRPYKEENLANQYNDLITSLKNDGHKLREIGLGIREIIFEGHSVEFGLPRIEEFTDEVHHSNFKAIHIADLDFSMGFKRRDFTINAVAFEYDGGWGLVDPLQGMDDIHKKLLRPCDSSSFVKDPVRFLRAVRFAVKLDLIMDPNLLTLLQNMRVKLSSHYLKLEAKKSLMPLMFFLKIVQLRDDVLDMNELKREEESIKDYSQHFRGEPLKDHIEQAYFLSTKIRKKILEEMGLSSKGAMEFPLREMNIDKVKSMSAKELKNSSWARGAIRFFSQARELGKEKVNWLMKESGSPYDFSFIEAYQDLNVQAPQGSSNELISFEILKTKIEKLAK